MDSNSPDFRQLLSQTIKANRQLTACVKAILVLWALSITAFAWLSTGRAVRADSGAQNDIVRARGLVIIDEHGKERVRIGAPLPEPIILGKQQKRDDSISGILIYDALGNERGGYVTDNSVGNAFFTLDSGNGQEVTLVAYPNGGTEFAINDDQKNKITMSALKNGPRLRLLQHGVVVTDLPALALKPAAR